MTENRDREIRLNELAMKFAGGDKDSRGEWLKTLRQAMKAGNLAAREKKVPAPVCRKVENPLASREWMERDFQTVGHTTIAGMPARVVAPTGRQALYESLSYVYHYVTPAAVAAWLHATMRGFEPPALVRAWLGTEWPVRDAGQQGKATTTEPSKDKRDKIREYLKRIASHTPGFDRDAMPGEKIDFHALLAMLDADFLAAEPDTFDGYLKKPSYLCKFSKKGRKSDFYEGLAKVLGGNSGKYRTALNRLEPKYEKVKRKRRSGAT